MQSPRIRIDPTIDNIHGKDMTGERIRVANIICHQRGLGRFVAVVRNETLCECNNLLYVLAAVYADHYYVVRLRFRILS